MSSVTLDVHEVAKLEMSPVKARCEGAKYAFFARHLRIVNDEGVVLEIVLYADTRDALDITEEKK